MASRRRSLRRRPIDRQRDTLGDGDAARWTVKRPACASLRGTCGSIEVVTVAEPGGGKWGANELREHACSVGDTRVTVYADAVAWDGASSAERRGAHDKTFDRRAESPKLVAPNEGGDRNTPATAHDGYNELGAYHSRRTGAAGGEIAQRGSVQRRLRSPAGRRGRARDEPKAARGKSTRLEEGNPRRTAASYEGTRLPCDQYAAGRRE